MNPTAAKATATATEATITSMPLLSIEFESDGFESLEDGFEGGEEEEVDFKSSSAPRIEAAAVFEISGSGSSRAFCFDLFVCSRLDSLFTPFLDK